MPSSDPSTGPGLTPPQGWYDPSDLELEEWLAILEGTLACKYRVTPRKLGLGTWTRLCGEFCTQVILEGKPDTLRALHWLDKWADAHYACD